MEVIPSKEGWCQNADKTFSRRLTLYVREEEEEEEQARVEGEKWRSCGWRKWGLTTSGGKGEFPGDKTDYLNIDFWEFILA